LNSGQRLRCRPAHPARRDRRGAGL
jgi:hypothetical protein